MTPKANTTAPNPGTPAQYAQVFRAFLRSGYSLEDLSRANHIGLESGKITLDHFRAAAEVLAEAVLKR